MKNVLFFLLFLFLVQGCSKVPVTGRSQLSLVSNSEILPMVDQEYNAVISEGPLSTNQEQVAMIKRVGNRIKNGVEEYMAQQGLTSQLEGFEWEFNLIKDDDMVNAWCMPGGKVAFYTGILPICQDENGVAVVMGHEVAHAIANHGRERMSQGLVQQLGLTSVALALGENPTLTQQIFYQSIGLGSQLGMLKFSRTHESEADKLGLIFMAIADYDPREAPEFWERMKQNSGGASPPEFLSTHPSSQTRINDLNKFMPEALKYYKGN